MNQKQAKSLRRLLEIKKPTPASDSGLFEKDGVLMFKRRSNPQMNLYRNLKRRYTRGW